MRSISGLMSLPGTSAARAMRSFRKSRSTGPAIRRRAATSDERSDGEDDAGHHPHAHPIRSSDQRLDTSRFLTMTTRLGERAAGSRQLNRPAHRMSWLSTARLPRPHDTERRAVAWTRWSEIAARPDDPAQVALLDALFGNSPYLTETALQNPTFMTDLWRRGPDAVRADLAAELAAVRSTRTRRRLRRPPWRRRCAGSSAGWRSPSPSPTSPRPGRSSRSPARSAPSPRAASTR